MKELVFEKNSGIKAVAWLSSLIASLDDKKYIVSVKQFRKKRSLDANAYCWVLIDKLSEVTGFEKEVIYQGAIKEIGGVSETVCVQNKAVEKITRAWSYKGLGWLTETFESKIDGCTNVILYYGSSTYDTAQMSRLIDNIVQECKTFGIKTMPPNKLEALIAAWK